MAEAAECYKMAFMLLISNYMKEKEVQKTQKDIKTESSQSPKSLKSHESPEKLIADYKERISGLTNGLTNEVPPVVKKRKILALIFGV